jgi:hypothetical protein
LYGRESASLQLTSKLYNPKVFGGTIPSYLTECFATHKYLIKMTVIRMLKCIY